MPYLKINDISIHYQLNIPSNHSNQVPIVLIHGLGVDLRFWDFITPKLNQLGLKTLSYDLRGHGKSFLPNSGYSIVKRISDLKMLLDSLEISKAILVGHSLGGGEVANFSISEPNYVKGLCLISSWISGFPVEEKNGVSTRVNHEAIAKEKGLDVALNMMKSLTPHRMPSANKKALELLDIMISDHPGGFWLDDGSIKDPPFNTYSKIKIIKNIPVLSLVGEKDDKLFHKIAEYLKENLDTLKVQILPSVGHMVPLEAPEVFSNALIEWIQLLK